MWIDKRFFVAKWAMRFYHGDVVYKTYTWWECEETGESMFIWQHTNQYI